jgi:hypothetical protein
MESTESAEWLRKPEVKRAFQNHYGGLYEVRERGYNLVVEYVPVRFDPTQRHALHEIETVNGYAQGEILSARYLKNPTRRNPGQATAFIGLTVKLPQTANKIIRQGLIIEGKLVQGREDIQEPRRCMKCQQFRPPPHSANTCTSIHDTCARCASIDHRMSDCQAEHDQLRCSNCQTDGHAASDHHCPVFERESAKLLRRIPDNGYKYFPILNDPTSWELTGLTNTEQEEEGERQRRRNQAEESDWQTVPRRNRGNQGRGTWMGGSEAADDEEWEENSNANSPQTKAGTPDNSSQQGRWQGEGNQQANYARAKQESITSSWPTETTLM